MIDVTCAVIRNEENGVLVVQRGESTDHPFKWEFPGGKVDEGETEEECIIREISEELSIDLVIIGRLDPVEHDYGMKQIRLIPFVCDTLDEKPVLSEHVAFKWLPAERLTDVDFSEADIHVAVSYLASLKPERHRDNNITEATEMKLPEGFDLQELINNMMSTKEAEWVAVSALENPAVFSQLFEYSLAAERKLAFRASWTLTKVCDKYPEIIFPYLPQIVEKLDKLDNEGALRSFLRILSLSDLNKISSRQHGILADFCFAQLSSGFSAIAVKAYAMEILYNLVQIYPELANELAGSIVLLMDDGSAGITSRGRTILKKLGVPISGTGSSQQ
jgi:8-oxo-dGTP diphosphatase